MNHLSRLPFHPVEGRPACVQACLSVGRSHCSALKPTREGTCHQLVLSHVGLYLLSCWLLALLPTLYFLSGSVYCTNSLSCLFIFLRIFIIKQKQTQKC